MMRKQPVQYHSAAPSSVVKSSNFEPTLRRTTLGSGRYGLPSRRPKYQAAPSKSSHTGLARSSTFYVEPANTYVPYKEIIDTRPPLRSDLSTPGPWHYSAHSVKPLNETNSPAFTMRAKCLPEKGEFEGGRTSWSKTWYQTPEVWSSKTNFMHESLWPDPQTYEENLQIGGEHQPRLKRYPAHTFGHRDKISFVKPNADKEPSPTSYSKASADKLVYNRAPTVIHASRDRNASLWGKREITPGPAAYTPNSNYLLKHQPSFSITRSPRQPVQPLLGPFSRS